MKELKEIFWLLSLKLILKYYQLFQQIEKGSTLRGKDFGRHSSKAKLPVTCI